MISDIPLIDNPTEFLTQDDLAFAQQGITPTGQPAPALKRACEKPEDIAQEFVNVYESLGGQDFLEEWARDNPGMFFNHLKSLAPKQQQITQDVSNVITIRHALPRSKLDGYDDIEDATIIEGVNLGPKAEESIQEAIKPIQKPKKRRIRTRE